jgi:transposase
VRFRQAQREIEVLEEQAKAGDRVLAYVDEAGFECVHPNRSAWTDRGQVHEIDATRGKRLNVLGAMLSTGEVLAAKLWQTTKGEAFIGFLGLLVNKVQGRPITVILDNASIHKSKEIKPLVELLKTRGLTLYFLPPYSPELNRIERLWHKMKHTWLVPKCRNRQTLEADVEEIMDHFGSKYYFSFY